MLRGNITIAALILLLADPEAAMPQSSYRNEYPISSAPQSRVYHNKSGLPEFPFHAAQFNFINYQPPNSAALDFTDGNNYQDSLCCFIGYVDTAWIRYYCSDFSPGYYGAIASVTDNQNNIYVAGYYGKSNDIDFYIRAYDSSGRLIWFNLYDGIAKRNDCITALAVDDQGNVYVTGFSLGLDTDYDFVVIKYDASGKEQWVRRYDASGTDESTDIAVDAKGNVYVTGVSRGATTYDDFLTIKYDSNGILQWANRYNGPGNFHDRAVALTLDDQFCVYVVGYSWDVNHAYDYLTVKYSTSGQQLWTERYDGPANGWDQPTGLAYDRSGKIYVTGFSRNDKDYDFATLSYNRNGQLIWTSRYNSRLSADDLATDIAVDQLGNVYVTGYCSSSSPPHNGDNPVYDYLTIKYDSSGLIQWTAKYNDSANGDDRATAISLDSKGQIYVTGFGAGVYTYYDYITIKYDQSGQVIWEARYHSETGYLDRATSMAVDNLNNIYVSGWSAGWDFGSSSFDYPTVKYDSTGKLIWLRSYSDDQYRYTFDSGNALQIDARGNIFVAGGGHERGSLFATIKYNPQGMIEWISRCYSVPNIGGVATGLALDEGDYVYVTGKTSGQWTTIKYDPFGNSLWRANYLYAEPIDIAVDDAKNVYVAGARADALLIKYDQLGSQLWERSITGLKLNDVEIDKKGNIYLAGRFEADYDVRKFRSDGTQQWRSSFDSQDWDEAYAMAIDHAGFIYVTGYSAGDYATVKFDSLGHIVWASRYDGTAHNTDVAKDIVADESGNVYVTGWSWGNGTYYDLLTVKYDSYGEEQWAARYNGQINDWDEARKIALDNEGNVYVIGTILTSTLYKDKDWVTIKYNPQGKQEWTAYFNIFRENDVPNVIAVDNLGNVIVSGWTYYDPGIGGRKWVAMTTIKYTQTPTSIKQQIDHQKKYSLSQNYPNPFNLATSIRFTLPHDGVVTLKIFNLRGQELATLLDEWKPRGMHQLQWQAGDLPSGIYLYRLTAHSIDHNKNQNFEATKKLIVLK